MANENRAKISAGKIPFSVRFLIGLRNLNHARYFQEFKKMMTQSVDLKIRLENAIRYNQQISQKNKPEINTGNTKPLLTQTPSIKLKTDFSNFS